MKLSYFHTVLLYCLNQFKGERSVSAIYHLLNGKKSSQTIQDGKLFNLTHMFGLFPGLPRYQVNDALDVMMNNNLIELLPEKQYKLTEKGKCSFEEDLIRKPIPNSLNGWKYGDVGRVFWRRLSLLVQVLSNFAYSKIEYLPVTKNQEDLQWIKFFLKKINKSKSELIQQIFEEIKLSLQLHSNKEASIFIQKLTSSHKIGLTFEQIAYKHDEDPIYIYLLFWNVIHSFIQIQQTNNSNYFLFNEIIKDKSQLEVFTVSTKKTRSYLLQGIDLPEIAVIRRLKESTIEDHVVEITLHDKSFTPSQFLTEADFQQINRAILSLKTHQLKKIKDHLNNEYSYFQIRLAYALNGREV